MLIPGLIKRGQRLLSLTLVHSIQAGFPYAASSTLHSWIDQAITLHICAAFAIATGYQYENEIAVRGQLQSYESENSMMHLTGTARNVCRGLALSLDCQPQ